MAEHSKKYRKRIQKRHNIIKKELDIEMKSLILPLEMPSNEATMVKQKELIAKKNLVGAIRQPTVNKPILRIIPRLGSSKKQLLTLCQNLNNR